MNGRSGVLLVVGALICSVSCIKVRATGDASDVSVGDTASEVAEVAQDLSVPSDVGSDVPLTDTGVPPTDTAVGPSDTAVDLGHDAVGADVAQDTGADAPANQDGGVDIAADAGQDTAKTLGSPCSTPGQCASGFCADGVCCNEACDGVCEQCSSSGSCAAATDDSACAQISCSGQTTPCKTYLDITTNRCKTRGQCKTTSDCTGQNKPARTECGSVADGASLLCDGVGNCIHLTVKCGSAMCAIDTSVACYFNIGWGAPGVCGSDCSAPMCDGSYCDETADCPLGSVCCMEGTCGGHTILKCLPSDQCVTEYCYSRQQVCNPMVTGECLSGTCVPAAEARFPSGYYMCQ